MQHCDQDKDQVRKGSSGRLVAALSRAILAGWAAGAGAALLDVKPTAAVLGIGIVTFILALVTALYGG